MKGITIATPRGRQRRRDPQTLLAGALTGLLLRVSGARRIALALGAAALLAIAAGTALAASASAAAVVTRESTPYTVSETGLTDECRPGLTGTLTGTGVFSVQTVETAQGFHRFAVDIGTAAQIDWSDGSYSIITKSSDRFLFNAGNGTTAVVFTLPHMDSLTTYTADGEVLYRAALHHVEHFTVTDGVVRVDFDHFHFVGGC